MRRSILVAIAALLAGAFLVGTPVAAAETPRASSALRTELVTWWHSGLADYYASGTYAGDQSARAAGYARQRAEAEVEYTFVNGTRPLYLFWHGGRGDNFTTATSAGIDSARAAGYREIRIEGYVYSTQVPGTVPLRTYWHGGRADNFSAASQAGINTAIAEGYVHIRIEGYVFPA